MKNSIIILSILDFLFTILGIELGYLKEANPIIEYIFSQKCGYLLGFIFKMILTILGINFLDKHNLIRYIKLCLWVYIFINTLHIFYMVLYYLSL